MENSSSQEEFERFSRIVENERLMELGSVTTWKHEPPRRTQGMDYKCLSSTTHTHAPLPGCSHSLRKLQHRQKPKQSQVLRPAASSSSCRPMAEAPGPPSRLPPGQQDLAPCLRFLAHPLPPSWISPSQTLCQVESHLCQNYSSNNMHHSAPASTESILQISKHEIISSFLYKVLLGFQPYIKSKQLLEHFLFV